jgi:RND family efflux transporter MFP subunit
MIRAGPLSPALAAACVVFVSACGRDNSYVAPPPPQVRVALPVQQEVTRYVEATGNTAAVNSANLVARVPGFLQAIEYRDGDDVKQGTTLFIIEPEPYKLKLEQAQAGEAAAQATLKQTEAEYDRQVDLANRQIASKSTLENATANRDSARAKLKQAQVDTEQAAINLGYTEVKAPFDGIVTARQVSLGELVGANGPTQLATIVATDPIYVNFNVGEQEVLRMREEIKRQGLSPQDLKKIPVEVGLQSEEGYPHKGTLDYAAPSVSQATGTLAVRAILSNPNRTLLPGYFVRVRVPYERQSALLMPEVALGSDQSGRYVLTIGKDNVVDQRKVTIGPTIGDLRVIETGLKPDDQVVIDGILRAIPGTKVNPEIVNITAAATK